MKWSVLRLFFISALLLNGAVDHVESLEPVSTAVAVGTALIGTGFLASYDLVKCKLYECCNSNWVTTNVTGIFTTFSKIKQLLV